MFTKQLITPTDYRHYRKVEKNVLNFLTKFVKKDLSIKTKTQTLKLLAEMARLDLIIYFLDERKKT